MLCWVLVKFESQKFMCILRGKKKKHIKSTRDDELSEPFYFHFSYFT